MKNILIVATVLAVLSGIGLFISKDTAEAPVPVTEEVQKKEVEMSGIHIMSDGSIMAPSGELLRDAEINADGNIVLPDGRVVAPMADYRK